MTAIMSGCDWYDADVEHLIIPLEMDIETEYIEYRNWYRGEYCNTDENNLRPKPEYVTFTQWLKKKGAREPNKEELEIFWED